MRGRFVPATSLSLYTLLLLRCTQGRKKYCYYYTCFAPNLSVGPQRNQISFFPFPCLLCFSPDKALSNTQAEQGAGFPPAIHRSAPAHPQGPWAGPVPSSPTLKSGSASRYYLSLDQIHPVETSWGRWLPSAPCRARVLEMNPQIQLCTE